MIKRPKPERFRLRRTMMFMNAQKPGLIKDAYIYGCDSIMLDLEDAVAENQKDAARFSLYHALTTIDYGSTEVIVRINGLDTPHWQEDIRVCVAGGADGIRIAKCESAQDVKTVEEHVAAAEREFGVEVGRTLLMAALRTPKLLLLDEHTAALDPKTAAKVLELTEKIVAEQKLTAMMVTHNMKDAIAMGNRLIMMNAGRIVVDVRGEEKKKLTREDLMQLFEKAAGQEIENDRMLLS